MTGPSGGSATWLVVDPRNPDPIKAVSWNATKIAAALDHTLWNGTTSQAMVCLSAFPALWADSNSSNVLNATFSNAWVSLAAELQALIAGLGVRVDYWEITNEWDQAYAAVGNTSGLAALVLATAAVLRAADPTVKVKHGGQCRVENMGKPVTLSTPLTGGRPCMGTRRHLAKLRTLH